MRFPKHRLIAGEAIRASRKLARLSQEQLAEKAELSAVYISRVECGKENISLDALTRIAKAVKIPVSDLLKGV